MLTVNLTIGRNKKQCLIVYMITAYEKSYVAVLTL